MVNVRGSVHRDNILIYIQQNETLQSLLFLKTAPHVSGGTTNHHQENKLLYLQHLVFFTLLMLPATIVAGSSDGVAVVCAPDDGWCSSCLRSWWWVVVPPETCREVSRKNKLCNIAFCWIYVRTEYNSRA